jgi:hypothetical protein
MKTAIVTTTINVPYLLSGYIENLQKHNHQDVSFIVIGDLRTPKAIEDCVETLNRKGGYEVDYWNIERQERWLKRFPDLDRLIPYNSIQRRNLGYLVAYESGCDLIISIDDDNYVSDDDFVGMHKIVGGYKQNPAVKSSTLWFNPCDLLEIKPNRRIYARGFPYSKRWLNEDLSFVQQEGRIAVNVGLWLETPDVDAVTHLEEPVEAVGLKPRFANSSIVLAKGNFSPFNSQNTAFLKDLLPCMYLLVMGDKISGLKIGRYDDIWMSYFAKKIIDHLGDFVSFGRPLVRQKRNPHDYIKDLTQELPGMIVTDKLIVTLDEIRLSSSDYLSCYIELAEAIRQQICSSKDYTYEEKAYFLKTTDGMFTWANVCRRML